MLRHISFLNIDIDPFVSIFSYSILYKQVHTDILLSVQVFLHSFSASIIECIYMASGNSDILYKYESMRIKWSRCFEEVRNDHVADSIKTFFRNFHRNHRGFTFVVGELYDGTTHLFVKRSKYRQIKNEIEERVDETLPDVAQFRDVTIIKRRISFQGFQSYRDFGNILKEKNLEVERRFVNRCVITSGIKQTESLAAACKQVRLVISSSSRHDKRAARGREGLLAKALLTRRKFLFYTASSLLVATCFIINRFKTFLLIALWNSDCS